MAKNKRLSRNQFEKKVMSLIAKYGKVRIVFQDDDESPPCGCLCDLCLAKQPSVSQRRRVLTNKGTCVVAYKGSEYKKWSGYTTSCFMDAYDEDYCTCSYMDRNPCECKPPKKTVKRTIDIMMEHDDGQLQPVLIEYGKRFVKKVKV